jgi:hypothetical protein
MRKRELRRAQGVVGGQKGRTPGPRLMPEAFVCAAQIVAVGFILRRGGCSSMVEL